VATCGALMEGGGVVMAIGPHLLVVLVLVDAELRGGGFPVDEPHVPRLCHSLSKWQIKSAAAAAAAAVATAAAAAAAAALCEVLWVPLLRVLCCCRLQAAGPDITARGMPSRQQAWHAVNACRLCLLQAEPWRRRARHCATRAAAPALPPKHSAPHLLELATCPPTAHAAASTQAHL
jgi:hypothetical protein